MNLQLVSISNGKFENECRVYIVCVCRCQYQRVKCIDGNLCSHNRKYPGRSQSLFVMRNASRLRWIMLATISDWKHHFNGIERNKYRFSAQSIRKHIYKKQNRNTRTVLVLSTCASVGRCVCVDMNRTHWISIESHLHFKTFLKTSNVSKWMSTDLPNKIEMDSVTND